MANNQSIGNSDFCKQKKWGGGWRLRGRVLAMFRHSEDCADVVLDISRSAVDAGRKLQNLGGAAVGIPCRDLTACFY